MDEIEVELEKYQNQDDLHSEIQQLKNQIDNL